ncbi:hypothetical protein [Hymenobacter jejuensis]|uniref:Uncharacterized protein n=1 Tax=Hymenobacter jejuensis TaxID=2502781 RepID=A0A5B7ZWI0_9BACT|nr:hypothetical protein [Hymenobacter jejuensis]QDA59179.1 hypothetical protein FHG12_03250 [Hymenobacter jejuensis]
MYNISIASKHLSYRFRRTSFELGPVGIIGATILLLVTTFLPSPSVYAFWPEPPIRLPFSTRSICSLRMGVQSTISLVKHGRVFFSIDDKYQTAVIEKVAKQHGVQLSATQMAELQQLPYLGLDFRKLPKVLSLTRFKRYDLLKAGIPASLANNQLSECIEAAESIVMDKTSSKPDIYIRADAGMPYAQVKWLWGFF